MNKYLIRHSLVLALLGGALAMAPGCKKGPAVEELAEEDLANPVKLFQQAVDYLNTPDTKTGEINHKAAYDNFVKAAELGGNPKAHFNAAWTAERLGNLDSAEKHYKAAYAKDASYNKAMFSLARVLNEQNKADDAVDLYKAYIKAHDGDLEVRNDLVSALTAAERYEEAEAEAQEILRRNPENADVYRSLSSMYFAQGKLGMSQLCNEKALALNEGDPGTYNNMGVTYLLQNDNERAMERLKTAVKLDRKNFEANMNIGFVALNSGDYKLALTSFQAATAAKPNSIDAQLGLAVALRGTGDFDGADKVYKSIIKAEAKNKTAYFNAATLHEKYTRNYGQAEKYLQQFIDAHTGEIGPNHEVYARMERIAKSKAEKEAREAELRKQEAERKEREERNKKLLKEMAETVTALQAKIGNCSDPVVQETGMMVIEQANMVIEMNDASMAGDLKTFVDDTMNQVDACVSGSGGEEPAPGGEEPAAPGGEEAPAPGGEEPAPQ